MERITGLIGKDFPQSFFKEKKKGKKKKKKIKYLG